MKHATKMPETSIIMGVYNIESIDISKMMDSILNQTYQDFEFIICDDGSIDRTYNIIKDYEEKDSRIRLIQNEKNMGLAYSLNKCLNCARGNYIARQDADDISTPNRLEVQINFLKRNIEVGFVSSNVFLFSNDSVWGKRNLKEDPKKKDMLFCSPFVHGALVIRKSVITQVSGYRISKETCRTEDYDLFMRMYTEGIRGVNIQDYLYFYREDNLNMSKRKYCYRIDEAKVRLEGFKRLGLMPLGYIFVLKPLIVGLIPNKVLMKLKLKFKIFKRNN